MTNQEIILSHILEYAKLKKWKHKKLGKTLVLNCIYCGEDSSQAIYGTHLIKCLNPKCKKKYTLISAVRKFESDKADKKKYPAEKIVQYLKETLKLKIMTDIDEMEVKRIFKLYESYKWSLVPIVKNGKRPVEKDWTNVTHYKKEEWENWLINKGLNIGVRTGEISNITVIDVDQKPIPKEVLDLLPKDCLIQETKNGFHIFFLYDPDFPKTRINELKIDIENNGGQVVIYPSITDNYKRIFIRTAKIQKMPEALKTLLKNKIGVKTLQTASEKIREEIVEETYKMPVITKDEGRNNFLIHMAGLLRKEFSLDQVFYSVKLLNQVLCTPPLPLQEIRAMMGSVDRYIQFDETELAHKILEYIKKVESSGRKEICSAMGEKPDRVAKALHYLVKEGYVIQRKEKYHAIKKLEWKTELINLGKRVDFLVPYLYDVGYFNWGDMILIGSKTKFGKCFAKGTKILMSDGKTKKVEDIIPTDKVMGIDSKPREVLDICTGYDTMYKIIPNGNTSFSINSEHILVLKHSLTGKICNITVKDYLKQSNTFKKLHKLIQQSIEYTPKPIKLSPYFLGLWLGDGDSRSVRITNKDIEIINFLKQYAKSHHLILQQYKYGTKCPSYALVTKRGKDNPIHSALKEYNLYQNKHIPIEYLLNSKQIRLELLAGLLDSDGYLIRTKTSFELISKNELLMQNIVKLARSLGFIIQVSEKWAKASKMNINLFKYFRISIKGNCSIIPTKIKRKKAIKPKKFKFFSLLSFKIKKQNKQKYYGFQVDKDQLYLLSNYIINHNTHIAMNIIQQLVQQKIVPYYISLETGSRFTDIALQLGLKEGDVKHAFCSDPTTIDLEPNAVTIIDWLLIKDKAKTDLAFQHFAEQLDKTNGFLIIFMQLKEKEDEWFAPNMVKQFPALATRYLYTGTEEDEDYGTYGEWKIDVVREPKKNRKSFAIPCVYNWDTKILSRMDELENGSGTDNAEEKPEEANTETSIYLPEMAKEAEKVDYIGEDKTLINNSHEPIEINTPKKKRGRPAKWCKCQEPNPDDNRYFCLNCKKAIKTIKSKQKRGRKPKKDKNE